MNLQLTPAQDHLPRSLVQAYCAGSLGPAASLAVAVHVQSCPRCAPETQAWDAVGGAFLDGEADETTVDLTLDAMLARLDAPAAATPAYDAQVAQFPTLLQPVIQTALGLRGWRFAGPGLRMLELDIAGATEAGEWPQLLKIEPGYGAPHHGHGGLELTLVLTGAFRDESGRYGPGDLCVANDAVRHRPLAEPGETCFAYAVSFAPMRFTGMLGLAQRLLTPRS